MAPDGLDPAWGLKIPVSATHVSSAAWLHGEQNGAEARKDRAMPASLPA